MILKRSLIAATCLVFSLLSCVPAQECPTGFTPLYSDAMTAGSIANLPTDPNGDFIFSVSDGAVNQVGTNWVENTRQAEYQYWGEFTTQLASFEFRLDAWASGSEINPPSEPIVGYEVYLSFQACTAGSWDGENGYGDITQGERFGYVLGDANTTTLYTSIPGRTDGGACFPRPSPCSQPDNWQTFRDRSDTIIDVLYKDSGGGTPAGFKNAIVTFEVQWTQEDTAGAITWRAPGIQTTTGTHPSGFDEHWGIDNLLVCTRSLTQAQLNDDGEDGDDDDDALASFWETAFPMVVLGLVAVLAVLLFVSVSRDDEGSMRLSFMSRMTGSMGSRKPLKDGSATPAAPEKSERRNSAMTQASVVTRNAMGGSSGPTAAVEMGPGLYEDEVSSPDPSVKSSKSKKRKGSIGSRNSKNSKSKSRKRSGSKGRQRANSAGSHGGKSQSRRPSAGDGKRTKSSPGRRKSGDIDRPKSPGRRKSGDVDRAKSMGVSTVLPRLQMGDVGN